MDLIEETNSFFSISGNICAIPIIICFDFDFKTFILQLYPFCSFKIFFDNILIQFDFLYIFVTIFSLSPLKTYSGSSFNFCSEFSNSNSEYIFPKVLILSKISFNSNSLGL